MKWTRIRPQGKRKKQELLCTSTTYLPDGKKGRAARRGSEKNTAERKKENIGPAKGKMILGQERNPIYNDRQIPNLKSRSHP